MNITIPVTGELGAVYKDAQTIATALFDFCGLCEQTDDFRWENYDWRLVRLLLSLAADVAGVRSPSDSDAIMSLLDEGIESIGFLTPKEYLSGPSDTMMAV